MKYLEDFREGETETVGGYSLDAPQVVEFARQWDPQPMHTDPDAARQLPAGSLIASGAHLLSITVRLLVTRPNPVAVIAGVSWDEVRFLKPARPGDVLSLTRECIEARPSSSKLDRGTVRNRITLRNQNGDALLSYIDTIIVARRPVEPSLRGE